MSLTNIEIKARSGNHDEIREILKSRNAMHAGIDHQTDTYFKVNHGRLKLREGNIEKNLIWYERENITGPKKADIILFRSDPSSSLKEILARSLGIMVVVKKEREIYFIGNVKFHLDKVEHLGEFVEIEAIDIDETIGREKLLKQCETFMELFKIAKDDLIEFSYSDLLQKK
jgi:predicted adenylyl cyclase CyaB